MPFTTIFLQSQLEEVVISNNQLKDQNTLLKAQLASGNTNCNSLTEISTQEEQQATTINGEIVHKNEEALLKEEIEKLKTQLQEVNLLLTEKTKMYEALTKDQEDLLELLTDQDTKINEYKNHMLTCTFVNSNIEN